MVMLPAYSLTADSLECAANVVHALYTHRRRFVSLFILRPSQLCRCNMATVDTCNTGSCDTEPPSPASSKPPPYQTLRGGNLGRGHKAAFKHVSMPTHTSPITRINACLSACAWTLSDGSRKIQDVTHKHSGQGYSDRSAVLLLNTVAKKTAFKYNVSLFSSGQ